MPHTYPLAPYFVDVVASAVLYTWLFNNTRGSLLIVTIFHAVSNTLGPFTAAEAPVTAVLAVVVIVVFGPAHLARRNTRIIDTDFRIPEKSGMRVKHQRDIATPASIGDGPRP